MSAEATTNQDEAPLTATETALEGRVYQHVTCGQLTRIRGKEMIELCDPFQFVSRTFCSGCSKRDSISRFRWRDTGESISGFRRRMRDESPFFCKFWMFVLAPLTAAIIGIDVVQLARAFAELPANFWIEAPLGVLLAVPLFCRYVAPRIMQALLRPSFHQQK